MPLIDPVFEITPNAVDAIRRSSDPDGTRGLLVVSPGSSTILGQDIQVQDTGEFILLVIPSMVTAEGSDIQIQSTLEVEPSPILLNAFEVGFPPPVIAGTLRNHSLLSPERPAGDGDSPYARLSEIPLNFGAAEFTFEMWVRPDISYPIGSTETQGEGRRLNWTTNNEQPGSDADWWNRMNFLIDGYPFNPTNENNGGFMLGFKDSGRVAWVIGDGSSPPGADRAWSMMQPNSSDSLLDGIWHRITLVRRFVNVSDSQYELWVDGTLEDSVVSPARSNIYSSWWQNYDPGTGPNDGDGWYFGYEKQRVQTGGGNYYEQYKGAYGGMGFYDVAKSTTEISNGLNINNRIGFIPGDEGIGNVANDFASAIRMTLFNGHGFQRDESPLAGPHKSYNYLTARSDYIKQGGGANQQIEFPPESIHGHLRDTANVRAHIHGNPANSAFDEAVYNATEDAREMLISTGGDVEGGEQCEHTHAVYNTGNLLVTWEHKWDPAWDGINNGAIQTHKHFQWGNLNYSDERGIELRTRYNFGDIQDTRWYNAGPPNWIALDPGDDSPPNNGTDFPYDFGVWTKFWEFMDWDNSEFSLWIADENRAPVAVIDRMSLLNTDSLNSWYVEANSSQNGASSESFNYVRNVTFNRNIAEPLTTIITNSSSNIGVDP